MKRVFRPLPAKELLRSYQVFFLAAGMWSLLIPQKCSVPRPSRFGFEQEEVQARLKADIEFLASEDLAGRPPGTEFELAAANYIEKKWKEAGLEAKRYPFAVDKDIESPVRSFNTAAFLDSRADSTLVVTAHFDHLGNGSGKSLEIRKTGIHPGADDNASGVAMMLELARSLSASPDREYNYLFVALSCHEIGLHGSRDFAATEYLQNLRIPLLLNLDMVGRLNHTSQTVRFSHCRKYPQLAALANVQMENGLRIRIDEEHETVNDYSVFCEAGLPAVSITSGLHEDYHRISDTPSEINYPGMTMILELCRAFLLK